MAVTEAWRSIPDADQTARLFPECYAKPHSQPRQPVAAADAPDVPKVIKLSQMNRDLHFTDVATALSND